MLALRGGMAPTEDDPFRDAREALEAAAFEGPGHTDPGLRRAAAAGRGLPPALQGYVDTVRRHAYRVRDEDVEALRREGYSEDQIYEITVCAALGAAGERLRAALRALEDDEHAPAKR
jgi:alkylhydroperoxidase family enzyme